MNRQICIVKGSLDSAFHSNTSSVLIPTAVVRMSHDVCVLLCIVFKDHVKRDGHGALKHMEDHVSPASSMPNLPQVILDLNLA